MGLRLAFEGSPDVDLNLVHDNDVLVEFVC